MSIDNKTRKIYKTIGHNLSPIVTISNGLTANVNEEIARALKDHELIKVKVNADDREEKSDLIDKICLKSGALLVQRIGHMALLYKPAKKPNPKLSNLLRHNA